MGDSSADRFCALGAVLGEGPVWLEDRRELLVVDILPGTVHRITTDGQLAGSVDVGEPVGAVVPATDGSIIAATPRGLRRLSPDLELIATLPQRAADLRMNDGKADPAGRYVGGTMTMGTPRVGAGSLWSFDGASATEILVGVTISNGLCWSTDGATLYYIDTPTHRVDVFDYDVATGSVSGRRTLVEIDPIDGDPDGMTIDVEGGLWVAMWGGGAVRRFDPAGHLTEVIRVPTPFVTCPTFMGDDLDLLAITTAADPGGSPGAGDVYVAQTTTAGRPAHRYRPPTDAVVP